MGEGWGQGQTMEKLTPRSTANGNSQLQTHTKMYAHTHAHIEQWLLDKFHYKTGTP